MSNTVSLVRHRDEARLCSFFFSSSDQRLHHVQEVSPDLPRHRWFRRPRGLPLEQMQELLARWGVWIKKFMKTGGTMADPR